MSKMRPMYRPATFVVEIKTAHPIAEAMIGPMMW